MSYNWIAIIEEYDENPSEFIKNFLAKHPINWSLFDTSFIEKGLSFAPEFAKQQGWGNNLEEYWWKSERIYRIIEHIVATDTNTPEVALLKIANEERWQWNNVWEWEDVVIAILNNPQATQEVLTSICLGFSYDLGAARDCKVFKYVFEHPCITEEIFEMIAEEAYDDFAEEPEKLMEYAPAALLEKFFDKISSKSYSAYSWSVYALVQSANISRELLERAIEYVLSVDKEEMIRDEEYSFSTMDEIIDNLLANPKTSKEFKDKLKELRNQIRVWQAEM